MMKGYAQRILHLDLSSGKRKNEPLSEDLAKKYIGGIGLGIRLLLEHCPPRADPLGAENPLILATDPLSGTMAPTGGNGHAFIAKSPQSYGVGEAKAHGSFGTELKRAGYDAVILKGKAESLCYLWIDDDSIEIMNASHMMGKSPAETESKIRKEHGDHFIRVAAIGSAGEKLVRIANIMNDGSRAAGRTGMGAVMGSKNLKAIAIRGKHTIEVAEPDEFMQYVKEMHETMKGPATRKYRMLGTPENVLALNALAALPTRNYSQATFEGAEKVSGETLNEQYVKKIIGCNSCAMRCEHIAIVNQGQYKGVMSRIEYEPLWALGPNCGIDRLDAVLKGMSLCNYYGIDVISAGVIAGFAMDCYEKGLLKKEDLNGIDARFGNHEALIQLIERIGTREGIGQVLSEGVKIAAEKIGKKAETLAQHIKGVEVTGYDLRTLKTAALGYAVSFRGADHNRHGAYSYDMKGTVDRLKAEKGRGKLVKAMEDMYALIDSLIVCKFSRGAYTDIFADFAKVYTLVTGLETSPTEMERTGERINNIARLFNIREGLGRSDDSLPWKVMNVPVPDEGPGKGAYVSQGELDLLLDDYYYARGWTKNGVPTYEKLKELDIEELSNIVKPLLGGK